jgi:AcrR family transcriptional regulator
VNSRTFTEQLKILFERSTHMAHEDKRQQLVEAAAEVFLRYGYRKTTLDDIAEAAGLQKSSLYHYFENKDELFREALRFIHDTMFEKLSAAFEGRRKLMEDLDRFIDVMRSEIERLQPNVEFMMEDLIGILPKVTDLISDMIKRTDSLLEERINRAIEEGELKPCPVQDLVVIISMFLQRVLKAHEFSTCHTMAADNAIHYVQVIFEPYLTNSTLSGTASST